MIWVPERSGPRETQRWPGQLRDDHGWEPDDHGWEPDDHGWELDGQGREPDGQGRGDGQGREPEEEPGQGTGGEAAPGQEESPGQVPPWHARAPEPSASPVAGEQGAGEQGAGEQGAGQQGPVRYSEPDGPRAPEPRWIREPDVRWIPGPADPAATQPAPVAERPVIGDQLRLPSVWCQLYPCIARHADPEALGEADARARAIAAGWREDRLGRLACPDCQQHSTHFWTTQPVVQWDRGVAVTMTSLAASAIREDAVGAAGAGTGVLPAALPVQPPFASRVPQPAAAPVPYPAATEVPHPAAFPVPHPAALPAAEVDEGYWARPRGGGRHRRRR